MTTAYELPTMDCKLHKNQFDDDVKLIFMQLDVVVKLISTIHTLKALD